MLKDAANGSNSDTTRDKHRSSGDIFMQREGSSWTAHRELCAKGSGLQCGLKASLSHAHRDHNWLFVSRRACERKGAGVVTFHAGGRRTQVGMLPAPKLK